MKTQNYRKTRSIWSLRKMRVSDSCRQTVMPIQKPSTRIAQLEIRGKFWHQLKILLGKRAKAWIQLKIQVFPLKNPSLIAIACTTPPFPTSYSETCHFVASSNGKYPLAINGTAKIIRRRLKTQLLIFKFLLLWKKVYIYMYIKDTTNALCVVIKTKLQHGFQKKHKLQTSST